MDPIICTQYFGGKPSCLVDCIVYTEEMPCAKITVVKSIVNGAAIALLACKLYGDFIVLCFAQFLYIEIIFSIVRTLQNLDLKKKLKKINQNLLAKRTIFICMKSG